MAYANIIGHIKHMFEKSNYIVNYSNVFIFLRQYTGYVITPHTHQWNKINVKEILQNHKLAVCDDESAHMVPFTTS